MKGILMKFKLFRVHLKNNKEPYCLGLNIVVEISNTVITRIRDTILRSDVEEGGKLIGKISQNNNTVLIKVINYIDSGPRVNNSMTHLYPNGDYQEAMFRVIETMDPEIEHLGSWHSHHCNGLDTLSSGDVIGYQKSVNNPQYHLDYFLVLLVTGIVGDQPKIKYHLFYRNQDKYHQINESSIRIIPATSTYEKLLESAEEVAFSYRYSPASQIGIQDHDESLLKENTDNLLKRTRKTDQQWLTDKFSSVTTFQNKNTGAIGWRWEVPFVDETLTVRYIHPQPSDREPIGPALLEITYHGEKVLTAEITLNDDRFLLLTEHIISTLEKIIATRRDREGRI